MEKISILLVFLLISGCANMPYYTSASIKQKYIADNPDTPKDIQEFILEGYVKPGMTAEQVIVAKGRPEAVHTSMYGESRHEQWVYSYGDRDTFLYFEDDILTSYQN